MKALTTFLLLAGLSQACTLTGTEHKSDVPVVVSADSLHSDSTPAVRPATHRADTLTLAFVGDIMPGTTFPTSRLPEKDGATLFSDVRQILRSADIAAGNMEGALADTGQTTKKGGAHSYAFRIPTRYARWLEDAGLDFMSMANNHAFDFGLAGVQSTEQTLGASGIAYAGISGRTEKCIVERNGVRYGFCAFGHNSYTLRHNDLDNVGRIIDELRQEADIVVVSFHGGAEGTKQRHLPEGRETFLGEDRGDLRRFAHFCIDRGADVVYGHGPHVVRAMEVYNGHLIAYSLGNFCTPYGINIAGISGYAPVLEVRLSATDGTFVDGRIHSFIQQYGRGPRLDRQNRVAQEIRSLTLSDIPRSGLNIASNGTLTKK